MKDEDDFIPPIFAKINALADSSTCGLVLDLRMNRGGRAVLGVDLAGRIFGEGDQLSYIDAKNKETIYWAFQNGSGVYKHGEHVGDSSFTSFGSSTLNMVDPWIAVLVGPHTASAAEMMAIASRNDARSVLIGEHTAGDTTFLTPKQFGDGSVLRLSTSYFSDMKGHVYPDGLSPDIAANTLWKNYLGPQDQPLKAAGQWLKSKGCT